MWFTSDPTFWMPAQASNHAALVDNIYYFLYWASVISFVACMFAGALFVLKYRAKNINDKALSQVDHSTTLELTWTLPVFAVAAVAFYFGVMGFVSMKTPPDDAYEVNVTAYKWAWAFNYANGHTDGNLHIPAGVPVKLTMSSDDVLHSFYVPAFRVKQDVVPNRYSSVWFQATKVDSFDVFCTEYCGTSHSGMLAKVIVHKPEDFEAWLNAGDDRPLDVQGESLFKANSCNTCHSIDGSRIVGPTFKGLFGSSRTFADGTTRTADEDYLRQSIMQPGSEIVESYPNVMPASYGTTLRPDDVTKIIEYIKTLK